MATKMWMLPVLLLLLSGCIESGSLSLPIQDRKIDISSLGSQFKNLQKSPSTGEMGVPLRSLPGHFQRSAEHGIYIEAFSLKGLPSTTIVWRVHKDPFENEFERLRSDSMKTMDLEIDSREISAVVKDDDDLYRIAAHIGLYTFAAETENPREIDSAGVYGIHEEVVKKVFEAGVKNALSFDLESLGD